MSLRDDYVDIGLAAAMPSDFVERPKKVAQMPINSFSSIGSNAIVLDRNHRAWLDLNAECVFSDESGDLVIRRDALGWKLFIKNTFSGQFKIKVFEISHNSFEAITGIEVGE